MLPAGVGVAMPMEFSPPKYAVIVNTVQGRIEAGTYPPGSTLPSEAAFMKEFGVSRPTTVRALELLRQQGWIDAHQGRGRTVLGSPDARARRAPRHTLDTIGLVESALVTVVSAGPVLAPPRAAGALGLSAGTPVIARTRLLVHDEIGPVELSTVYVPVELAAGTTLADPAPLADGVLRHLTHRHGVAFDHATERISARTPTAEEARLLAVGRRDCLLTVPSDRHDRAATCVPSTWPPAPAEVEDAFTLSWRADGSWVRSGWWSGYASARSATYTPLPARPTMSPSRRRITWAFLMVVCEVSSSTANWAMEGSFSPGW
jgi:GntR family transcriptional regulator